MKPNAIENDRVNTRIRHDIKLKAQANIEKSGLTLSEYMRIILTQAAENGLPDDFALPNHQVIESIGQFADSLEGGTPLEGGTVDEFERALNS
ncbi:type II toxin-antitoxin system RelB/DinJ family antitoxin [Levilactobacillus cerevisiae]|uniref:type II toxin-antitoxin system RelB/DinJ family antitoxin n=1 Tax=Levilactobacillus cerevisiae TaxID=1704076 RepID=UPI000F78B462|nr:type II toxin-antitoxin system RelB/DinJ family antitoxin [Levilactobacillus cerevisiae]